MPNIVLTSCMPCPSNSASLFLCASRPSTEEGPAVDEDATGAEVVDEMAEEEMAGVL